MKFMTQKTVFSLTLFLQTSLFEHIFASQQTQLQRTSGYDREKYLKKNRFSWKNFPKADEQN
jgi:hypothetical protein